MLSLANGEEISSVRPEAGALGLIQQTLKTVTMDDASKHLWISKNPVFTCLATLEKKKKQTGFLLRRDFYMCILILEASAVCYLRATIRHPAALRGTVAMIVHL